MEASGVRVYLKFDATTEDEQISVLQRLHSSLSPDMTLSEEVERPSVWVQGPDDDAASIAVQYRLYAICRELGLSEDQVTTTLDPNQL